VIRQHSFNPEQPHPVSGLLAGLVLAALLVAIPWFLPACSDGSSGASQGGDGGNADGSGGEDGGGSGDEGGGGDDSGGVDGGDGGDGGGDDGGGDDGGGDGEPVLVLDDAFPELTFDAPLAMLQAPGLEDRWFLIERAGRVLLFNDDPTAASTEVALDITGQVDTDGEGGLLGVAFHPGFASSGAEGENRVYLSYTRPPDTGALTSVISEFTYDPEGGTIDAGSEFEVLTLEQPYRNHNGGQIAFGPDGYLYIGFGDGGSSGDPQGNGQDLGTRLGKFLRIEVNPGAAFSVPVDNPMPVGGLPEIWAWGFRNPWRWSFDRDSGALWVGDVGQNAWEEVDLVEAGGNYGWNVMEGEHCYGAETCVQEGLAFPVAEYSHDEGCSITGGYVWRRDSGDAFYGHYLFADFCEGRIWSLGAPYQSDPMLYELLDTELQPVSFAESAGGELYLIDYGAGRIYRIGEE